MASVEATVHVQAIELTKRDLFAALICAGLPADQSNQQYKASDLACIAVEQADWLIHALDNYPSGVPGAPNPATTPTSPSGV